MKYKPNSLERPNHRRHYRIGFSDLTMDSLWDPEADKYKVFCRLVHVTSAVRHIGYAQWVISMLFFSFFFYHYLVLLTGFVPTDHWIQEYTLKYLSQLLLAIMLQLLIVCVLIYGVKTENRSFLLPYVAYASIAILTGFAQLGADFVNMDYPQGYFTMKTANGIEIRKTMTTTTHMQFLSHLIGTLIHVWCLSVVWRCYGYYGDKKMARSIGEQLRATQSAFQYPDQLLAGGYMPIVMPQVQPPPYVDTLISSSEHKPPQQQASSILLSFGDNNSDSK